MTLRQDASKILGIRVGDHENSWESAMGSLDVSGMLTAKHRNALILMLCKHVEALEKRMDDNDQPL